MKRKNRKIRQTTLLIVAEGAHDKAFLDHIKSLYDARESGQRVKIESGDGGSPHDLIKNTIKKISHIDYNKIVIFMDSDVEIRASDRAEAKRNKITLILSEPVCLEGYLLRLLGRLVPSNAEQCKSILHGLLSGPPTETKSYACLFNKEFIESSNDTILDKLKAIISNTDKETPQ